MGKYFGTDGFRGEANLTLTADHAFKVGRFLGWYFTQLRRRERKDGPARIVIGKDTRRSSYMFEYTLVSGLVASGADAYLLHVTTTPSVAYVARTEDFDCGIMISASHNPYYDNGIKLINSFGEKMDESVITLIEAYLDGELVVFGKEWPELPLAQREQIGRTVDHVSGRNRYIGHLIGMGQLIILAGCRIIDDIRTERFCNICNTAPDIAKTNNSPCFSTDFMEMFCKMCEDRIVYITLFFHIAIVIMQFLHEIK